MLIISETALSVNSSSLSNFSLILDLFTFGQDSNEIKGLFPIISQNSSAKCGQKGANNLITLSRSFLEICDSNLSNKVLSLIVAV